MIMMMMMMKNVQNLFYENDEYVEKINVNSINLIDIRRVLFLR